MLTDRDSTVMSCGIYLLKVVQFSMPAPPAEGESDDEDLQVPVELLRARSVMGGPMTSTQKPTKKRVVTATMIGDNPKPSTSAAADKTGSSLIVGLA